MRNVCCVVEIIVQQLCIKMSFVCLNPLYATGATKAVVCAILSVGWCI